MGFFSYIYIRSMRNLEKLLLDRVPFSFFSKTGLAGDASDVPDRVPFFFFVCVVFRVLLSLGLCDPKINGIACYRSIIGASSPSYSLGSILAFLARRIIQ